VSEKYPHEVFFADILVHYYDDFFARLSPDQVRVYSFTQNTAFSAWPKLQKRYPQVSFLATVPNIKERNEIVADGHPNAQGHQTIAKVIFADLRKQYPDCFE
jgi:hypothetical protein